MDTIYVVVKYRDVVGTTEYRLSRAFTHYDQAMRYISAIGVDPQVQGNHQPVPRDSIYDASVLGQGNIRVALIPVRITVGSTQERATSVAITHVPEVSTQEESQPVTQPTPSLPVGREPLSIRDGGEFWYVSGGNTYIRRSKLKDLGGRWNPNAKIWIVPKANVTEAALRSILQ